MEIKPIATIKNDYDSKFAVPRQSGIADKIMSQIVFENEFADENAIRGIDGFSHLWLIWGFSKNIKDKQNLTVRPPDSAETNASEFLQAVRLSDRTIWDCRV